MSDRIPTDPVADNSAVLPHLLFLDNLSAEQIVNLIAFLLDRADNYEDAASHLLVIDEYVAQRHSLMLKVTAQAVGDRREMVRFNAVFGLLDVIALNENLAEKWARQLMTDPSKRVRLRAVEIIGGHIDEWTGGASDAFVAFVELVRSQQ